MIISERLESNASLHVVKADISCNIAMSVLQMSQLVSKTMQHHAAIGNAEAEKEYKALGLCPHQELCCTVSQLRVRICSASSSPLHHTDHAVTLHPPMPTVHFGRCHTTKL